MIPKSLFAADRRHHTCLQSGRHLLRAERVRPNAQARLLHRQVLPRRHFEGRERWFRVLFQPLKHTKEQHRVHAVWNVRQAMASWASSWLYDTPATSHHEAGPVGQQTRRVFAGVCIGLCVRPRRAQTWRRKNQIRRWTDEAGCMAFSDTLPIGLQEAACRAH